MSIPLACELGDELVMDACAAGPPKFSVHAEV
jgi:hypothetical protein